MECYLDNSATTKPSVKAVDAAAKAMSEIWGNPSSLHQKGVDAYLLLEQSRKTIAKSLKAQPEEIYFTPCGTVSNNTAIFGAVRALRRRGNKIVTTALEHPSVAKCMERLAQDGFEIATLAPNKDGNISLSDFETAIDEKTILVSLMSVNNEVGSILPFDKIKKIIQKKKSPALLHVDNVQGYLKLPVVPKTMGIDLLSMSAHKVHGPKGIGALYMKKGVNVPPYLLGGGQENNMCSGTQGMPAIAAFAAAVEDFGNTAENLEKVTKLNESLCERLLTLEGVNINSPKDALPYILNISLSGIPSQVSVNYLSAHGVYVSAGSACSKGHRSDVLTAMELPPERIDSAIRLSFAHTTTQAEVDYCFEMIKSALTELTKK